MQVVLEFAEGQYTSWLKFKQLMLIKQPYAVKYCLKMVNRIKNVNLLAADMRLDDYIVGV
jgi:hypothetical protein